MWFSHHRLFLTVKLRFMTFQRKLMSPDNISLPRHLYTGLPIGLPSTNNQQQQQQQLSAENWHVHNFTDYIISCYATHATRINISIASTCRKCARSRFARPLVSLSRFGVSVCAMCCACANKHTFYLIAIHYEHIYGNSGGHGSIWLNEKEVKQTKSSRKIPSNCTRVTSRYLIN